MAKTVIKLAEKELRSIIRETIEEIVLPYEIKDFFKGANTTEWQYYEI